MITDSLNSNERRALNWLVDSCKLDRRKITRKDNGVDLTYGDIGIEIKSRFPYSIRLSQLRDCDNLEKVYIVISNEEDVYCTHSIINVEWGSPTGLYNYPYEINHILNEDESVGRYGFVDKLFDDFIVREWTEGYYD